VNVAHLGHLARPPVDADPAATWAGYRNTIEHAIVNSPRDLQTRIGPSGLGVECDRCLISQLAQIPEKRDAAWLPTVGKAVHSWLEDAFTQANARLPRVRYLIESQVTVGIVGGVPITGNADLFDLDLGEVTDWKIVGKSTLTKAKAHGPTPVYRRQAHLYGFGFAARGLPVKRVRIAYLPRNEPTLSGAVIWSEPYDETTATDTIARANMFAAAITAFGVAQVLTDAAPHTGDEFSCTHYPNPDGTYPTPPGHTHQPGADLKGLIAS